MKPHADSDYNQEDICQWATNIPAVPPTNFSAASIIEVRNWKILECTIYPA